jgi:hypothetical protein
MHVKYFVQRITFVNAIGILPNISALYSATFAWRQLRPQLHIPRFYCSLHRWSSTVFLVLYYSILTKTVTYSGDRHLIQINIMTARLKLVLNLCLWWRCKIELSNVEQLSLGTNHAALRLQEYRQGTYNVTLKRLIAITVSVEKQWGLRVHNLWVYL